MSSTRAQSLILSILKTAESITGKHPLLQIEAWRDQGCKKNDRSYYRYFDLTISGNARQGHLLIDEDGSALLASVNKEVNSSGRTRSEKSLAISLDPSGFEETVLKESDKGLTLLHKGKVMAYGGIRAVKREESIALVRQHDAELIDTDPFGRDRILLGKIPWTAEASSEVLDFVLRVFRFASIVAHPDG